jgi:hypothetical protein
MSEAKPEPTPYEKFRAFAKQVLAAPKKEVDRALANERNIRAAKRKARKVSQ